MGFPPGETGGSRRASPGTGDARVDQAVARLGDLAALPAAEHPAVFEYVHERLAEALGDLAASGDEDPGDEGSPGDLDPPGDAVGAGGPGS